MSYAVHSIAAVTEIPELVGSFAASIGWDADVSVPTQPVIRRPVDSNSDSFEGGYVDDPISWRVRATVAGTVHRVWVEPVDSGSNSDIEDFVTTVAETISPVLDTPAAVQFPTHVHLIGSLTPEPYIGIVIQYNDNLFRHLYVGNMEKIGSYGGGEVASGTLGPASTNSDEISHNNYTHVRYLFQSRSSRGSDLACGGVMVDWSSVNTPWKVFRGTQSSNPMTALQDTMALGGYGDSINDGYLSRANAPFANLELLVPINLYAIEEIIGDVSFVPIGKPSGIRMVSMRNLLPGQEIVVGGFEWRVFPASSRRAASGMPRAIGSTGSAYREYESSYWVGYAYAVGQEDSNSPS